MEPATFDAIIADVSAGEPVRRALAEHGVNPRKFYALTGADEEAAKRYARAKATGCHAFADETIELCDEVPPVDEKGKMDPGFVAWKKQQIETRKWHLAKLLPKVYGDAIDLKHSGAVAHVLHIHDEPKGE